MSSLLQEQHGLQELHGLQEQHELHELQLVWYGCHHM